MSVDVGIGMCGDVKHPNGLPLHAKIYSISWFGYLLHKVGSQLAPTMVDIDIVGSGSNKDERSAPAPHTVSC